MSESKNIAEIQNLTIAELGDAVADLNAKQLQELRALEVKETNRVGALEVIDAALATKAEPDAEKQKSPPAPVATATAAEEPADWQRPDYSGSLDIEKMDWRRRNIKPVRQVKTK